MKFKGFIASWAMCVALVVPASSHPHVFIDAEVGFDLSNDGQLMAVSITWIYDPFTSLTLIDLLDLDQDNDGVMSDADLARIVQAQTVWPDSFNGDTYLEAAGTPLMLGRPINGSAEMRDVRIAVSFELPLAAPFKVTDEVELRLYDPAYYYAYSTLEADSAAPCDVELQSFEPSTAESALQRQLARLSQEETPEQDGIGRLFSDVVRLQCA